MENDKIKSNSKYSSSLLLLIIFLQVLMIPWILNVIYYWSDAENNEFLVVIASLLLCPIISVLVINNSNNQIVNLISKKLVLIVSLFIVALVDLLLYLQLNRIFPSNDAIPSGWMAASDNPWIYFNIWAVISFNFIIPICLLMLKKNTENSVNLVENTHISIIILGLMMGLRWGGSWSIPLHNSVYILILIPIIYLLNFENNKNFELFPSSNQNISLIYQFAFWICVIEFQIVPQLSSTWLWFIPLITNLGILLIRKYIKIDKKFEENKILSIILWVLLCVVSIFIVFGNLWVIFNEAYMTFLIFGLILASLLPEMIQNTLMLRKKTILPRFLFSFIGFLIGFLTPLLISIYDPISSYVVIAFFIITLIIGSLGIKLKNNR